MGTSRTACSVVYLINMVLRNHIRVLKNYGPVRPYFSETQMRFVVKPFNTAPNVFLYALTSRTQGTECNMRARGCDTHIFQQ